MRLLTGALPQEPGDDPALELALAHAMVRDGNDAVRVYRPSRPMLVFGRRDTRLPGFAAAVDAGRVRGFAPAVRATGGRAVAYTEQAVVLDLVHHEPDAVARQEARFLRIGGQLVDLLRQLGVDARLGDVPGEYCPGAHSVNARGTAKLVGTAQRVVRDAWLFSALVQVDDAERVAECLDPVYRALEQPFDPRSVGAVADEAPGLTAVAVEQAVLGSFAAGLAPEPVPEAVATLARTLLEHHLP
ncbi:MAG TPA: lipoate--protein ligase family protein [Nocardioidaceae bacterium]|nr:lipoate--protein ligase family protein [Nocardioidaceae bacterium]